MVSSQKNCYFLCLPTLCSQLRLLSDTSKPSTNNPGWTLGVSPTQCQTRPVCMGISSRGHIECSLTLMNDKAFKLHQKKKNLPQTIDPVPGQRSILLTILLLFPTLHLTGLSAVLVFYPFCCPAAWSTFHINSTLSMHNHFAHYACHRLLWTFGLSAWLPTLLMVVLDRVF